MCLPDKSLYTHVDTPNDNSGRNVSPKSAKYKKLRLNWFRNGCIYVFKKCRRVARLYPPLITAVIGRSPR